MEKTKKTGAWLPIVKKVVDEIYEYLIQHPDGITMSVRKEYGASGAKICTELVSRNIVEKQLLGRGKGCKYKWVASMAPTKVLYGSIAQKLYDDAKEYRDSYRKSHPKKQVREEAEIVSANSSANSSVILEPVPDEAMLVYDNPLEKYETKVLWDEILRRGCYIKDGRLAQTVFFD